MIMDEYCYRIDPRPADLGGGWRLCLLEQGEEVGGGVFSLAAYEGSETPETDAYQDALDEASDWMASRGEA